MEKDAKAVQFGQRLRELRKAKGLDRKQLADVAGLSERAIIKWELGEREPGWFNIVALCAALGVSCEEFRREPQPAPPPERGRPKKDAGHVETPASKHKPKRRKGK